MNNTEVVKELKRIKTSVGKLIKILDENNTGGNYGAASVKNMYLKDIKCEDLFNTGEMEQEYQINEMLKRYPVLPSNDSEYKESVVKIIKRYGLSSEVVEETFKRISKQNDKEQIRDIKKYTYSCLNKIGKN